MRLIGSLLILVGLSSAAFSDWQYTDWKMNPEEVVAASGKTLKPCSPSISICVEDPAAINIPKLIGDYQTGGLDFAIVFLFNRQTNRLSEVSLKLKDPTQSGVLIGALENKYGYPGEHDDRNGINLMVWHTNVDQVILYAMGPLNRPYTMVALSYRPRLNDLNKGL